MDHHRFKNEQTAALYVANELDSSTQEAFELHMMTCGECLDDVETWRALKNQLPQERSAVSSAHGPNNPSRESRALRAWKIAAGVAAIGTLGALAGWFGHASQAPKLGDETAFFNLPPITRGFDCTPLRLAPSNSVVFLRVPGATPDTQLIPRDVEGKALPARDYSLRVQADGSWLIRLERSRTLESGVRLETRDAAGHAEPLGCIASTPLG
jgi:hypothetical protein